MTQPTTKELNRTILGVALPIAISNASVPLIGAVDTAVVGHMDTPVTIGAIAVGALIFSYISWVFGFLRSGTTGLVAQADGAGDQAEVRAALIRALGLGLICGLLFVSLSPLVWQLAELLIAPSGDVGGQAKAYFDIRLLGSPATLANAALTGWFFGKGRAGRGLVLQLYQNGMNALLDALAVFWLGLGVEGVAAATIIAEWTALVLGLGLALPLFGKLRIGPDTIARLRHIEALKETATVNGNMFVRSLILTTAFGWVTAVSARQGDVILAVNAILMHYLTISAYAMDGFAIAAERLIGKEVGGKDRASATRAMRFTAMWAGGAALLFALGFGVFGDELLRLMTSVPDVLATAETYLWWVVIMPLAGVWCFQMDGFYIGLTDSRAMRNAMAFSFICYIGIWWALTPIYGNDGLWAAFLSFLVIRGATLHFGLGRALDRKFSTSSF